MSSNTIDKAEALIKKLEKDIDRALMGSPTSRSLLREAIIRAEAREGLIKEEIEILKERIKKLEAMRKKLRNARKKAERIVGRKKFIWISP